METKVKAVHYINQFFGGIGGEEKAGTPLQIREGAVGPGKSLENAAKGSLIIEKTILCGDNYFQDQSDEVLAKILDQVKGTTPQVLIAGPAFNAGRYGLACRAVCEAVSKETGIPTVTAMYPENPGASAMPIGTFILQCGASAREMGAITPTLASFAYRLATGAKIIDARTEGYIPRGRRLNIIHDEIAAVRAVNMLKAKMASLPFQTEISMPGFDRVPASPPIPDLKKATIALVTDGGLVTKGNPDRLEAARATKWFRYSFAGMQNLEPNDFESIHGGCDTTAINLDPDRLVPVDVLREMERKGEIGKLFEYFYSTTGNATPITNSTRIGKEIGADLLANGVNGVIVTSTWGTSTRCGATISKEIERSGIPAAMITAMTDVAQNVGAPRVIRGFALTTPVGNPELDMNSETKFRTKIVLQALQALISS